MPEPLLQIEELTKVYGATKALRELSLEVHEGDVYGLVGPNGAGKTSCFKICATIMRPTFGRVRIDGVDLTAPDAAVSAVRHRIGYMPDAFGVYEDMTVGEYLAFFAAAYEITGDHRRQLVGEVRQRAQILVAVSKPASVAASGTAA